MSSGEVRTRHEAFDRRRGMTAGEIRQALALVPGHVVPTFNVSFKGVARSVEYVVEPATDPDEGETLTDRLLGAR